MTRVLLVLLATCTMGCGTTSQQRRMAGWGLIGGGTASIAGWMGSATYVEAAGAPGATHWKQAGVASAFSLLPLCIGVGLVALSGQQPTSSSAGQDQHYRAIGVPSGGDEYWVREQQCNTLAKTCHPCPNFSTDTECTATGLRCHKVQSTRPKCR